MGPDGHLYVADAAAATVKRVSLTGLVTTFAGSPNNPGNADGTGTASRFLSPNTLCFAKDGTLVVADKTCLRRITPSGQVTTWVGDPDREGYLDSHGTRALFRDAGYVTQMSVDAAGNVLYPDPFNNVVRVVSPAGDVRSLCRNGTNSTMFTLQATCDMSARWGSLDPSGSFRPWSVSIDAVGNQYVFNYDAVVSFYIYRDAVSSQVHPTFGPWLNLNSVAIDAVIGAVYLFDSPQQASRIFVRHPKSNRVLLLVGAEDGTTDGQGTQVRFGAYGSIAMVFDNAGHMYVNFVCSDKSFASLFIV